MGENMGASKTYKSAERINYWRGMFDWICAPTADCLTCQNNKLKPNLSKEELSEEWQSEIVPPA